MSKFVVVVFPDEAKANEGVRALEQLHAEGSLAVYAGALIVKDADGKVSVKEWRGKPPIGAALGTVLGGLVGLIGGPPVAALAAAGGALAGGWRDVLDLGVDLEFLDEVSKELTPGRSAIAAEIEEDWVTPLDSRMEAIGGVVLRAWRDDLGDERILREAETRRAELAQLRIEHAQAGADRLAPLQARVDQARAKYQDVRERIEARIDQLREEAAAKIAALQDQAAEVEPADKERIEERIAEIRSDHERRSARLKETFEVAEDALAQ